jgi:aminoglycoside phosphotransferase (APT) family kinase protein
VRVASRAALLTSAIPASAELNHLEAHRTGILHKDLKTANVIVTQTPDGRRRA